MEILVDKLNTVEPVYQERRKSALSLDVDLEEDKLRKLFFEIWNEVSDAKLNEWLRQEGYELQRTPGKDY